MRAAALVRDNVLKVEYPKKLNFRMIFTFRSPFSMKHTGQRFEGRVAQNVSEILNFWDTLPSKSCPVWNSGVNLEPLWGDLGTLWVNFGVALGQIGRSWCQVVPKSTLSWPKLVPSSSKLSPRWLQIRTSGHFGSNLGSLWAKLTEVGTKWSLSRP